MNFKVGERVAVYGKSRCGKADSNGATYIVTELGEHKHAIPFLFARHWADHDRAFTGYEFHPKQCRRLVKKPRRELWVAIDHYNGEKGGRDTENPLYAYYEKPPTANDWRLFREVIRKRGGKE